MTPAERQTIIQALEDLWKPLPTGKLPADGICSEHAMRIQTALKILNREQEPRLLWLWRNFVDGAPEYLAFDNPFPVHMDCGDPQTLGEPCGYALLKQSRAGRTDVSNAEVVRRIKVAGLRLPQK